MIKSKKQYIKYDNGIICPVRAADNVITGSAKCQNCIMFKGYSSTENKTECKYTGLVK